MIKWSNYVFKHGQCRVLIDSRDLACEYRRIQPDWLRTPEYTDNIRCWKSDLTCHRAPQNDKGPPRNVRGRHRLLNKGLICRIDRTWQGCSEEFAPFLLLFPAPSLSAHPGDPIHVYTHRRTRMCVCVCLRERPAEGANAHSSPARPHCSVWCKLCMCKKHSIIRPSIIRGCQWALSGWYITLSCPLPQLGPTQPARHAGNTAGETYSTGRDLGLETGFRLMCLFNDNDALL